MKIGFIGAGKMATAIASSLIDAGVCSAAEVIASDASREQLQLVQKSLGIEAGAGQQGSA